MQSFSISLFLHLINISGGSSFIFHILMSWETTNLVPRPQHRLAFHCLQYKQTASNGKLNGGQGIIIANQKEVCIITLTLLLHIYGLGGYHSYMTKIPGMQSIYIYIYISPASEEGKNSLWALRKLTGKHSLDFLSHSVQQKEH